MNPGPDVSKILPPLARGKGFSQARLEEATGIGHSTMSRYWSGRGGLGEKNARRIADALDVAVSDLGLSEEVAAVDEIADLRRALAALEETVALLTQRVAALEPKRVTTRRAQPTQKQKAV